MPNKTSPENTAWRRESSKVDKKTRGNCAYKNTKDPIQNMTVSTFYKIDLLWNYFHAVFIYFVIFFIILRYIGIKAYIHDKPDNNKI